MSTSSTVSFLNFLSIQMTIYIGIPTIIFGIFGAILNIIVFLSLRIFRENSAGIYLIMMSFVNIVNLTFGYLYQILVDGFLIKQINNSFINCTLRMYITQTCGFLSVGNFCLAIIDQYMATSQLARFQQWSHPKIAYRVCIIVSLFWMIVCIPHFIYYNEVSLPLTNTTICTITNSIYASYIFRFYAPILASLLHNLVMIIFGLLAYKNVRQISYRTVPLVRRQHEIQITKMVLIQALISVLLISPYFILFTLTYNIQFSNDPIILAQIQLTLSMSLCLSYMYFSVPFYIYTSVSKRYRQQLFYVISRISFRQCCYCINYVNDVAPDTH